MFWKWKLDKICRFNVHTPVLQQKHLRHSLFHRHTSSLKNQDIFRWTWDLKSATWSLDHKDQHTWIWKWLTSGLGRYKASNISTLWILLLRPIIVTLPFNCSAPRDHNSTRLQTKKDFSHMSVFSKSQLSSPNRLRDIGAWSLCNGAQCTRVSPKGRINCEIKVI